MTIKSLGARLAEGGPVFIAALVGLIVGSWVYFGDYSSIEATTVNLRFRLRNDLHPWDKKPENIVYIDINDAALLANTGGLYETPRRWPWPRSNWADIHPKLSPDELCITNTLAYSIGLFDGKRLALPDFSPVLPGSADRRPFLDLKSARAQLAHIGFHFTLYHSDARHNCNDRCYAGDNTDQRQKGTKFIGKYRIKRHLQIFTHINFHSDLCS